MGNYQEHLIAEAASWCIDDPVARAEKIRRERMRHPKLIRDLLLDKLGTQEMSIAEIGGGPEPLSDLLPFRTRIVIDPLTNEYKRFFPCNDHVKMQGEELTTSARYDLVICTNALDHVENPEKVVANISRALKPGGYFAVMCAINNALTNPHPAHEHNLTAHIIHEWCDREFETAWELTYAEHGYRYGWPLHEGRRGQPAFALLLRKAAGYA